MSQKLLLPAPQDKRPQKSSPRKRHQPAQQRSGDNQLERLWDDLLSGQPEKVRAAYDSLDPASQNSVLNHLQNMADEAGWQPEQRRSAQAAIQALKGHSHQE